MTRLNNRSRAVVLAAVSAAALCAGVTPLAAAGPGRAGIQAEVNFVTQLRSSGFPVPDRNARAVTDIAYELCDMWLDGTPGPTANSEVLIYNAAVQNLCPDAFFVGTDLDPNRKNGPGSPAARQGLADVMEIVNDSNSRSNERWLDTDADDDGHSDANDNADYDDGHY